MKQHTATRIAGSSAIGWISTADTLLFGLVFVLIVAVFLDGQRQNVAIQLQNNEIQLRRQQLEHERVLADANKERQRAENERKSVAEERDRLVLEKRLLDERLVEREKERDSFCAELADSKQKNLDWETRFEAARVKYAQKKAEIEMLQTHLTESELKREGLEAQIARLQATLVTANEQVEEYKRGMDELKKLGAQLIGLKGKMKRVVILFDHSASMLERGRWAEARAVVELWLKHLSVDQCALVAFSEEAEAFPAEKTLLDLHDANREKLLKFLASKPPKGGTNTLAALKVAYSFPNVDTIILFTDGAPNNGYAAGFDPKSAEAIYKLCAEHKNTPINAIGLGDYFKPELSSFLLKVANQTNGTFLGK